MGFGTEFLQKTTQLIMLSQRMSVMPVLNRLRINPYDHVTEESGQRILNNLGVDYLITGKLLNVAGKWIIRLDDGNGNSIDSDPLDREAMISLIKKAKEGIKKDEKKDKERDKEPETPPKDVITPNQASLPRPDLSNKVIFRTEGIRSHSFTDNINADISIAVYPPKRNSPNASAQAGFIIFNNKEPKILSVNLKVHKDVINGVLVNSDIDQFYTYSDDGVVIAYSSKTFEELYRLNNIRPVKTLSLTNNGFLVTNFDDSGSKVFSIATKSEVKQQIAADNIRQKTKITSDVNITARDDGIMSAYGKDGGELFQLALFLDNEYAIIFRNSKKYSGSNLIGYHLDILEPSMPKRRFQEKDRDMRA